MNATTQPTVSQLPKPIFSGHESFACRQFWLKKAYDYTESGGSFSDPDAVVHLGVGKNMVTSIQYWAKAFGVIDDNHSSSELASRLFSDSGWDPYLEDIGSLYLLHYSLVSTGKATIFPLAFNEFHKERLEFTRDQLQRFLNRKCEEYEINVSAKTLERDATTFVRTYLQPDRESRNIEDDYSGLLFDLAFVEQVQQAESANRIRYRLENRDREQLPAEVVLYTILDKNPDLSVSFSNLLAQDNSPGAVFALTSDGLLHIINEIVIEFDYALPIYCRSMSELQFINRPDKWSVLEEYYRGKLLR